MQVVKEIIKLQAILEERREENCSIGFVPTMGALHQGHISLVEKAGQESDFVVVSIFVNPTQFNDPNDLDRYPRDLDKDLSALKETACNLVFAPEPEEIYPEVDSRRFYFDSLEETMEGRHRPGHFNGVAQVVSKLFEFVKPDKAFFGQKDFQQLSIIKALVKQLQMPVEIVPCPIVREESGLAMSSRNMLLSNVERKNASHIWAVLQEAKNKTDRFSVEELRKWVIDRINENRYLNTEYFEIVDDEKLMPVKSWSETTVKIGCIAVHCGKIRLIDNIVFND